MNSKIEIHMLKENEIIEKFEIDIKKTTFKYKGITYNVEGDDMYLFPTKESFTPTLFYKKGVKYPIKFSPENPSIPARALHLLWNHTLYKVLVQLDKDRTNLIVIILLIMAMALYGIRIYLAGGI
jgi:hypothetical protein